jgi:hypothetical protein
MSGPLLYHATTFVLGLCCFTQMANAQIAPTKTPPKTVAKAVAKQPTDKSNPVKVLEKKTTDTSTEQPEPEYTDRYGEQQGSTFGIFEKGAIAYTLATDVNLRETATVDGKVVTTIPIGTAVKIEEQLEKTFKKNGFSAPWHKISYTENGTKKIGYVWGGMLTQAIIRTKQTDATVFLFGLTNFNANKMHATLQVRAARNGKEVAKMEFGSRATFEASGMHIQCVSLGTAGFTNGVADALLFHTGYEACAYTQSDRLIMWDGTQLHDGYEATSTADGGVFAESNEMIFPNEKDGKPQAIVVKWEMEQTDEKEKTTTQRKSWIYKWTGKKFVK